MRGTISEWRPGSHVVIIDLTGGVQRFEAAAVAYAGPAADEARPPKPAPSPEKPATPAPPAAAQTAMLEIALEGTQPDTAFWILSERAKAQFSGPGLGYGYGPYMREPMRLDTFKSLCTAPCTRRIAPGTYHFGLSSGESRMAAAPAPTRIERDVTLRGTFNDHGTTRAVGWALLVVGPLAGVSVGIATAMNDDHDPATKRNLTPFFVAAGAGFVAAIVGLALTFVDDSAELELVPRATAQASPPVAP